MICVIQIGSREFLFDSGPGHTSWFQPFDQYFPDQSFEERYLNLQARALIVN